MAEIGTLFDLKSLVKNEISRGGREEEIGIGDADG